MITQNVCFLQGKLKKKVPVYLAQTIFIFKFACEFVSYTEPQTSASIEQTLTQHNVNKAEHQGPDFHFSHLFPSSIGQIIVDGEPPAHKVVL